MLPSRLHGVSRPQQNGNFIWIFLYEL